MSLNTSGMLKEPAHFKMKWSEKCIINCKTIYFTFSRYWYRWSKYITKTNTLFLIIIFLTYFYFNGSLDTATALAKGYLSQRFQQNNLDETQFAIATIQREQEKLLKIIDESFVENRRLNETINKIKNVIDDFKLDLIKNDSCFEFDGKLKYLESEFEKIQHDFRKNTSSILSTTSNVSVSTFESLPKTVSKITRQTNLASRKNGARIIAELSSDQLAESFITRLYYYLIFKNNLVQWPLMDRSVINSGEAFCFQGNHGIITIQLSKPAAISSVLYEHDYWDESLPISAPKNYTIKGCLDANCEKVRSLGECHYSKEKGLVAQECIMNEASPPEVVSKIQMQILSNYGQNYTCIYSIKVY